MTLFIGYATFSLQKKARNVRIIKKILAVEVDLFSLDGRCASEPGRGAFDLVGRLAEEGYGARMAVDE